MMNLLPTLAEPRHFALWERVLFLVLAAASVYGFWRRFGPILGKILQSKKEPDFHLFPIGKRVWDFVWEVLLQAKVICERPLAGLAHALVFWAFCAFALVTINHCAVVFGVGFLDPAGRIGRLYFDFAAVFAVACAAGILGLFVRRFFVRPKWLGNLSWGSGLVALLIFALMATYLAAFFVTGPRDTVQMLWWSHTLTLVAFLPLIPHTKHLHLVLSPFTVFLSRGEFAYIPPLSGDEDFGLIAGKDLTQLVSLQAYSCVECGRCMEHCPANATGKVLNPKEIILGLRGYLNDFGPKSEEPLLGKYNTQEAAFECTTCGACEFQCPVGIEHVPIIVGLQTRRGEYRSVGERLRIQVILGLGTRQQCAGHEHYGARQVCGEERTAGFRWNAGVLLVAGLHGRVRSAGSRNCAGACACDAAPGRELRRIAKRKMHRRSGPPPRE